MPETQLLAEYTPPQKASFLLRMVGALMLALVAFWFFRYFKEGGFARAEWMLYPVILAVVAAIGLAFEALRRDPTVSLYENGIRIGRNFINWNQVDEVRYRRFENRLKRIEYEWIVYANGRQHQFSMVEPNAYINRTEINSALKGHVSKFRDSSRII